MAVEKYTNQLTSVRYSDTIKHYKDLRYKFFKELGENIGIDAESFIKVAEESMRDKINQSFTADQKEVSEYLNVIFELFVSGIEEIFSENDTKFLIQKIQKKIKEIEAQTQKKTEEQQKAISQAFYDTIADFGKDKEIRNVLANVIGAAPDGEAYKALLERSQQFFKIYLDKKMQERQETAIWGMPAATLGGFLREQMELEALQQLFGHIPNIKINPGGTKKVQGKETHLDNIISVLDYIPEAFNQQITVTRDAWKLNKAEVLKSVKYYGEQVKSFKLNARSNTGAILGKRIAENETLLKNFQATGNPITIYNNIKFLHRTRNAITALGPETLIFATGSQRMFTDAFISEFRKKNYYLMFGYDKNTYRITRTIVIDQPWKVNSKKKNQRTIHRVYSKVE